MGVPRTSASVACVTEIGRITGTREYWRGEDGWKEVKQMH
jgi:hypothetical protein